MTHCSAQCTTACKWQYAVFDEHHFFAVRPGVRKAWPDKICRWSVSAGIGAGANPSCDIHYPGWACGQRIRSRAWNDVGQLLVLSTSEPFMLFVYVLSNFKLPSFVQVSEQMDSLRMLGSDPIDYLVTPRVLACMIAGPVLNILCFAMGIGAAVLLAEVVYDVSANIILDSVANALTSFDIVTSCIKAVVFGTLISSVSCSWGFTTTGGAKGVGESTTSAVVISLVLIFIADFFLSFLFFQGSGDALRQCM